MIIGISLLMIAGCAASRTAVPVKIALLAPFEGRYREVGYEMLYAARLALAESNTSQIELLPIDDGGNLSNARNHAAALALNMDVQVVIAAGFTATHPDVLSAFGDVPVIIAGNWRSSEATQSGTVFRLTSNEIAAVPIESDSELIAFAQQTGDFSGGELLSLDQFRLLDDDLTGINLLSSAVLPSPDFVARYRASDAFAPDPRLLSTLTYDATSIAAQIISTSATRQSVTEKLQTLEYEGINGLIRFGSDGYWQDAPLHRYQYDADGQLIEVNAGATP